MLFRSVSIMSAHSRTCGVTYLTFDFAREKNEIFIMVRLNIVQSIRYDSGHHKEFRKSPKITFHIRKVGFRISEKFQNFSIEYRNVLENSVGPMVGPLYILN